MTFKGSIQPKPFMILCTLDCHNLFLLIFSTCFINVILLSHVRILLISAVDVQLVPPLLSAGCTGKDVMACLCCCTLPNIKYDHYMDSLEFDCYLATREKYI